MRNVLDKSCRENRNTHFIFKNFFSKNRTVYEIMPKNMVENERPQMTSQYGAYAFDAGLARLHVHARAHAPGYPHARTHRRISNTYSFSTATVVTRTRLDVTLYVHCPSCWSFSDFRKGFKVYNWHRTYCTSSSSSSSVICQTTGPQPLPKRFFHLMRFRASSFK